MSDERNEWNVRVLEQSGIDDEHAYALRDKPMLFVDTTVRKGGLLDCERQTIKEYVLEHAQEHTPAKPLIIGCKYEPGRPLNIILEAGVWRWNVATEE
jgi:hypothetical protein